nr:hypothetical protein Itr_chr04CG18580 [Ipomoea trifida]
MTVLGRWSVANSMRELGPIRPMPTSYSYSPYCFISRVSSKSAYIGASEIFLPQPLQGTWIYPRIDYFGRLEFLAYAVGISARGIRYFFDDPDKCVNNKDEEWDAEEESDLLVD